MLIRRGPVASPSDTLAFAGSPPIQSRRCRETLGRKAGRSCAFLTCAGHAVLTSISGLPLKEMGEGDKDRGRRGVGKRSGFCDVGEAICGKWRGEGV